jgi:adenosine deaminase
MPEHPWHGLTVSQIEDLTQPLGFLSFLECFKSAYQLLTLPGAWQRLTEDLCLYLESQGITKADVHYAPGVALQRHQVDLQRIHGEIEQGLRQFPAVSISWVLDTVINCGAPFMEETLRRVSRTPLSGLRGFSIGGGLPDLDMTSLLPLFDQAASQGLTLLAHVGEVDGWENIDILLEHTDIRRIAHGLAAAASERTLQRLARRKVMVDLCLTSNLCTQRVPHLDAHPLPQFLAAGVPVSLNSDDPFFFKTTLHSELATAANLVGESAVEKIVSSMPKYAL